MTAKNNTKNNTKTIKANGEVQRECVFGTDFRVHPKTEKEKEPVPLDSVRTDIRACSSWSDVIDYLKTHHPKFLVKRWGRWEYAEASECYELDGKLVVALPPAWSVSFRDIKNFSYNFGLRKVGEGVL